MRRFLAPAVLGPLLAAAFLASASTAVAAPCTSQGSPAARVVDQADRTELWTKVAVNLGYYLQIMDKGGLRPVLEKMTNRCERPPVQAAGTTYALRGEDQDKWVARVALPANRKADVAFLIPVPDMAIVLKTADASVPPTILGYALVSQHGDLQTAWRLYDAIPTDAVLSADLTGALAGRIRPAIQVQKNNVRMIVPTEKAAPAPAPDKPDVVDIKAAADAEPVQAFVYAAFTLGTCEVASARDKAPLEEAIQLSRLKLDPRDEPQRAKIGRVIAMGRTEAAATPRPADACPAALARALQRVQAAVH